MPTEPFAPRIGQVHEMVRIIEQALDALQIHARHMTQEECASIVSQIEGLKEKFDATATIAQARADQLDREQPEPSPLRCIRCRKKLSDDPSGNCFYCRSCDPQSATLRTVVDRVWPR